MKRTCAVLAATLLAALHFACSSSAAVSVTWTGQTGFFGNDGLGLFGAPGQVSDGLPYAAQFVFDTTIGFEDNVTNGSQSVTGGSFFLPATPSPLLSASITINGVTVNLDNGDYDSQFFRQTGQGASAISALAQREIPGNPQPFGGELFQRVFRTGNFYSLPLDAPAEIDFGASDNPSGQFLFFNRDAAGNLSGPNVQIPLIPSHVSIAQVPVPEPASVVAWSGVLATTAGWWRSRRRR